MRARETAGVCCALGSMVVVLGCGMERDLDDPGAVSRATRADPRAVRCEADENGNLRVRAPAHARVTMPSDAPDGATAEISTEGPDDYPQMPRPQRPRSISLGFIGDGKLHEAPNHGDRWSYGSHDDILPPHPHGGGGWGQTYGSRYGSGYGYAPYGYAPGYVPRGYHRRW